MRAWLPHLLLSLLLAAQWTVARVVHRDADELQDAYQNGSTQEQLEALHVLTNRGELAASTYGAPFVRKLMKSPQARLREYAYSTDVCKFVVPNIQSQAFSREMRAITDEGKLPSAEWFRTFVIFQRKVGGGNVGGQLRLRIQELHWFLDAVADRAPEQEALLAHMDELWREMRGRNQEVRND